MTEPIQQQAFPPKEGDQLSDGGKVMSLFDHLGELRQRIVKSLVVLVLFCCVTMYYAKELINFLKQPLVEALPPGVAALHYTGPMDVFMAEMKVGFLAAIFFSCPVWIYQLFKFVEPALYPRERKYVMPFVVFAILFFLGGVTFCYYGMLPMSLKFLIGLGTDIGVPIITIADYLSLLTLLLLGFGAAFETPVILVLLGMLDIISADMLAQYRRYTIVIILIVAALITPPDPVSQLTMAIPMYLLYELSIFVIRVLKRKQT